MPDFTDATILSNSAWLNFNAILFAILAFSYGLSIFKVAGAITRRIIIFCWFVGFFSVIFSSFCFFFGNVQLGKNLIVFLLSYIAILYLILFILLYLVPLDLIALIYKWRKHPGIGRRPESYFEN